MAVFLCYFMRCMMFKGNNLPLKLRHATHTLSLSNTEIQKLINRCDT